MKPFRYWRDPLCLVACALYGINRFWFRHTTSNTFFTGQFDDFLLIPCALPPVLGLQRLLGLRDHDRFPGLGEIAFHLVVWSVIAEVIGPRWMPWATSDWKDVAAYTGGAAIAAAWWWARGRSAVSNFRNE